MNKRLKVAVYFLAFCFVVAGIFLFYSYNNFKVQENFVSIPLSFDPNDSTSTYDWKGANVTIKGSLDGDKKYYIRVENVDPTTIKVSGSKIDSQKIIHPHTLLIVVDLKQGEEKKLEFVPQNDSDYSEFVLLGDNRNGYETFSKIIDQINFIKPAFVIDNGDLVYDGEPNKYRLFYETVSKLNLPLYTTLGNHDIRENGRPTYTKLFGPAYYSSH